MGLNALHSQIRTLYTLTQQGGPPLWREIHHVAGTRLLAIFGAPVAQEDHARRALLAAQRLAAYRSGDPAEELLAAYLSLHTGLMVMGGIGEAQGSATIVGDLTLAVEALQERASPGILLCSEATARLVRRDVRLEEVAPVLVPGQPSPLQTYQVMGLNAQEGFWAPVELRAHCGITPADGDDAITAKVWGSLQAVGLAPDPEASSLLHLLGVEAATAQVAGISPDTLKARTFATLRQLWLKSSQHHPLILAVEDLHWSDPTSEEFVASLVEGLPGAALLVLGTYRPGYRPAWLEKSYATQLTLPPLRPRTVYKSSRRCSSARQFRPRWSRRSSPRPRAIPSSWRSWPGCWWSRMRGGARR